MIKNLTKDNTVIRKEVRKLIKKAVDTLKLACMAKKVKKKLNTMIRKNTRKGTALEEVMSFIRKTNTKRSMSFTTNITKEVKERNMENITRNIMLNQEGIRKEDINMVSRLKRFLF